MQRSSATRLLEAAPAEVRERMTGLFLAGRAPFGQPVSAVGERAERLVKSGRLDPARRKQLEEATGQWREQTRALNESSFAAAEDAGCSRALAESAAEQTEMRAWYDATRKLERALFQKFEAVATDADLDWLDQHPAPAE